MEEDYAKHRERIDEWIKNDKSLLFIAHSQGNLFVNAAYDYAKANIGDLVKVIHVAPPTAKLNGKYVLADKDKVITSLIFRPEPTDIIPEFKERLSGVNNQTDSLGHGFVEIYINKSLPTAARIQDYMNEALEYLAPKSKVEYNCPKEPDTSCPPFAQYVDDEIRNDTQPGSIYRRYDRYCSSYYSVTATAEVVYTGAIYCGAPYYMTTNFAYVYYTQKYKYVNDGCSYTQYTAVLYDVRDCAIPGVGNDWNIRPYQDYDRRIKYDFSLEEILSHLMMGYSGENCVLNIYQ